MNFTEYCLYTKNYSALNAVKDYTKSFGILGTGLLVGGGIIGGLLGHKVANTLSAGRKAQGKKELGGLSKGLITAGGALHGAVVAPTAVLGTAGLGYLAYLKHSNPEKYNELMHKAIQGKAQDYQDLAKEYESNDSDNETGE